MDHPSGRLIALAPWTVLGLLVAMVLSSEFPAVLLLLFVVAVIGAILAWLLDPGWEIFGVLVGLAVFPVMLARQGVGCATWDTPDDTVLVQCFPDRMVWPYYVVASVLFVTGALLGLRGARARPLSGRFSS